MRENKGLSQKGQFSTFMKPIIVIIFGLLLISLLTTSLNFNLGLAEERSSTQFQETPGEVFSDMASCLSVNERVSGGSYVLNQTKLERMERSFNYREPLCGESFRYGYEVNVKQNFMQGTPGRISGGPVQVAFVLDDTGSMNGPINGVKDNIRDFLEDLGQGRAAIVTFKDSPELDQGFTNDIGTLESTLSGINAGGGDDSEEDVSGGMQTALEDLTWQNGMTKAMVVVNNAGAHDCDKLSDLATEANNQGIRVFTVANVYAGSCKQEIKTEIPSTTDGETFSLSDSWASTMNEISGQIGGKSKKVGGQSTCTLNPVKKYDGSAQIVFAADASKSFEDEWDTVCNRVQTTVDELEAKGLKTNVSIYVPGQPGAPDNGQGVPMPMPSGGDYNHNSGDVPSCVASSENNAVTSKFGKGITEWNGTGLVDYNPSKDHGLEAWGVFSKWILENHHWDFTADKRMMFVIGDHDPTGGTASGSFASTFRDNDDPNVLDTEGEIVNNVTNLSERENVSIYMISGDKEYKASDNYGNNGENDAKELMEKTSSETGGTYMTYDTSSQIPDMIKEKFVTFESSETQGSRTCNNLTYRFGEMHGSEGQNADSMLRTTYPASIRQSESLTTPATVSITLRDGALEKLAGGINKAISNGERSNSNTTVYISIENDETLTVGDQDINRSQRTRYILDGEGPGNEVEVNEDMIVGINGQEVFSDRDGSVSNIDFSNPDNQFKAYKGANIQLIAINTKNPELKLEELSLECAPSEPCSGSQVLNNDTIDVSQNMNQQRYNELGGIGVFFHNFTTIKIGNTETVTEKAACYQGTDQCVVLRSDNVENLRLRPGSHEVTVRYSPSSGVEFLG